MEDDDNDYFEFNDCQRCNNTGLIVTCCDDMCRGLGECIHGDGETICPDCGGDSAF